MRLHSLLKTRNKIGNPNNETVPHVIRKASIPQYFPDFDHILHGKEHSYMPEYSENYIDDVERASHRPVVGLTAEIALFFDAAGYKIFAPYFSYDDAKLRDMLLAYINAVCMKCLSNSETTNGNRIVKYLLGSGPLQSSEFGHSLETSLGSFGHYEDTT